MRIGLLYEGLNDELPLKIIVFRVLEKIHSLKRTQVSFQAIPARTAIMQRLNSSAEVFFNSEAPVAFSVYVTDSDGDRERVRDLETWVKKYESLHPGRKIVYGVPAPHLEMWMLKEGNALKSVLSISGESSIIDNSLLPKLQVEKLFEQHNIDITRNLRGIYQETFELINLDYLSQLDTNFKAFYDRLLKQVKSLENLD
jgi:hypothetical protein